MLLGPHGTSVSRELDARTIAEWEANGRRLTVAKEDAGALSIDEMLLAVLQHAQQHYRGADGLPTDEKENMRDAIRLLKNCIRSRSCSSRRQSKLKAVRERLLNSRRYFARFTVKVGEDKKTLEWWAWERGHRQAPSGCEARWQKKWTVAEVLDSKSALSRGVINARPVVPLGVRGGTCSGSRSPCPQGRCWPATWPDRGAGERGVKPVAVEFVKATLSKRPASVARPSAFPAPGLLACLRYSLNLRGKVVASDPS